MADAEEDHLAVRFLHLEIYPIALLFRFNLQFIDRFLRRPELLSLDDNGPCVFARADFDRAVECIEVKVRRARDRESLFFIGIPLARNQLVDISVSKEEHILNCASAGGQNIAKRGSE